MASNCNTIQNVFQPDMDDWIFAVPDGNDYYSDNGNAGTKVLDHVRSQYNIKNDRTYLLGESVGTRAALSLGLDKCQSYFAAYWANDVNASASHPIKNS